VPCSQLLDLCFSNGVVLIRDDKLETQRPSPVARCRCEWPKEMRENIVMVAARFMSDYVPKLEVMSSWL
jgi:hypothetical protein